MMAFTILKWILVLMLLTIIAAGMRMMRARRTIRAEVRSVDALLVQAEAWAQSLRTTFPPGSRSQPTLQAVQMAASALHFPEVESLMNNPLSKEVLGTLRRELERRRRAYPRAHNQRVFALLEQLFPDVIPDKLDLVRLRMQDVDSAYERLGALDERALDNFTRFLGSSDSAEKTQLQSSYAEIQAKAILDAQFACVRATAEAKQAIVGLSLDPSDQSGLATYEEVLSVCRQAQ